MSTEITYNGGIVARVAGGEKAILPVQGLKMRSNIEVIVSESSSSGGTSISTGTLEVDIDYNRAVYAPVLSSDGSITYSSVTTGQTATIDNVILNAPFTLIYGTGVGASYLPSSTSNVTILTQHVNSDNDCNSLVGILTSSSGWINIFADCCFDGTSQILMTDGSTKALADVAIGDIVMTYNEANGEAEANEVTALGTVDLIRIAELALEDGTAIRMNRYHPLWTEEGWKSLIEYNGLPKLTANDKLMNNNGDYIAIKSIDIVDIEEETYYTIKVASNNNFYVNGILAQGKDKD